MRASDRQFEDRADRLGRFEGLPDRGVWEHRQDPLGRGMCLSGERIAPANSDREMLGPAAKLGDGTCSPAVLDRVPRCQKPQGRVAGGNVSSKAGSSRPAASAWCASSRRPASPASRVGHLAACGARIEAAAGRIVEQTRLEFESAQPPSRRCRATSPRSSAGPRIASFQVAVWVSRHGAPRICSGMPALRPPRSTGRRSLPGSRAGQSCCVG
jgi:hypothetical protein